MHQAAQAAIDSKASVAPTDCPDTPSMNELRSMLEDFVQLHKRPLSVVVGHELASTRGTAVFPPMDARTECVRIELKLRDLGVSPASVFEYIDGILSCPVGDLPAQMRQLVFVNNAQLHRSNCDPKAVALGHSNIPAICESVDILLCSYTRVEL